MRISIREQLGCLLLLSSLIGLAVISIAVWCTVHGFVLSIAATRLANSAALKAAQLAQNLELMQTIASFLTTRPVLQTALASYGNGSNVTEADFAMAETDILSTLGFIGNTDRALALQARVFAQDFYNRSAIDIVVNVTGPMDPPIQLPWDHANGTHAYLGNDDDGYPRSLYPNITVRETMNGSSSQTSAEYNGVLLDSSNTLVLGPLIVNSTFSLLSLTLPILKSTMRTEILGWLTMVMDGRLIQTVIEAPEGLGTTGTTLLVGPVNTTNLFPPGILYNTNNGSTVDFLVHYLFPINESKAGRHPSHAVGTSNLPFLASTYPAIQQAVCEENDVIDNTGTMLSTHNENNSPVAVGFSLTPSNLVNWVVLVEQARSEVWAPINRLREIILACLFGIVGFITLVSFPLAHLAILPIRRLTIATAETVEPLPRNDSKSTLERPEMSIACFDGNGSDGTTSGSSNLPRKEGLGNLLAKWHSRVNDGDLERALRDDKPFRVPSKVRVRRHWIKDELTELTEFFNSMAEELFVQYARLEERVRERTAELEQSKKAAEAANESKTLFIANMSHELKTPLNGILGLCQLSINEIETDPAKVRSSLRTMYNTGDLLLKLLTDILTFSHNQVEQALRLDEREFKIGDIEQQAFALFGEAAKKRNVNLAVELDNKTKTVGSSDSLAAGTFRSWPNNIDFRDVVLWGDQDRILQVVMNLIGNSLKFTSAQGSVVLTIRCLDDVLANLRHSSSRASRRGRGYGTPEPRASVAMEDPASKGTANLIRPLDPPKLAIDRPSRPRPPGTDLLFEVEVRDTGVGIPEDMLERIFEPFVQADAGLNRAHGGTGLGLAICSQLASLMRGSLRVTSKVNEGSTFTMQIPLRRIQSAECTSPVLQEESENFSETLAERSEIDTLMTTGNTTQSLAAQTQESPGSMVEKTEHQSDGQCSTAATTLYGSTEITLSTNPSQTSAIQEVTQEVKEQAMEANRPVRVLVAEDNKLNQEVVCRMLKLEKISDVTIANDGQEALDLVKESMNSGASTYDIIFMDIQMPVMDGLTSTKLIRGYGWQRPIIALTAFAAESNVQECLSSGMDHFLAKPIKRPLLRKVLTEYCSPDASTRPPLRDIQTAPA